MYEKTKDSRWKVQAELNMQMFKALLDAGRDKNRLRGRAAPRDEDIRADEKNYPILVKQAEALSLYQVPGSQAYKDKMAQIMGSLKTSAYRERANAAYGLELGRGVAPSKDVQQNLGNKMPSAAQKSINQVHTSAAKSPSNGDTTKLGDKTYTWSSAKKKWEANK
jgi:hypothetical protein